jgi:hypothetical protein
VRPTFSRVRITGTSIDSLEHVLVTQRLDDFSLQLMVRCLLGYELHGVWNGQELAVRQVKKAAGGGSR